MMVVWSPLDFNEENKEPHPVSRMKGDIFLVTHSNWIASLSFLQIFQIFCCSCSMLFFALANIRI